MKKEYLKTIKNVVITVLIPGIFLLIITLLAPDKITGKGIISMLTQAIVPAILAWGVCFNIKVGNWDFSVGAAVLTASIVGGNIAVKLNLGIIGVIVFCVLVGAASSTLTGLLFRLLKVPSLIASIGVLLILESLCGVVFGGGGVLLPNTWVVLGKFPTNVIIGVVIFALTYFLYNNRKLGYQVRAVGNGMVVAQLNGIDVYKVKFLCFLVAGVYAGFYSFMNLGATGVTKPVSAMGTMATVFDAMMCVFVAMSLGKFCNLIVGVYVGSVTMQVVKLGLMVFGFPSMYNQVIIAVFVLIFMSVSSRSDIFEKLFSRRKRLKISKAENA